MTLVPAELDPALVEAGSPDPPQRLMVPARGRWHDLAEHTAMLLALVVWARVVTTRGGGRDDGALLLGSLALVPALLVLRPPLRDVGPMLALVAAAFAVCWLSPYGFSNAQVIAMAACTGAAFAVVKAYAATPERRLTLAAALCLVSLDQFGQAFLAWWGSGNPQTPMIGTFFWHNQYAAFLLPGALVGSALALLATRLHRVVGLISAPVCFAGIVYSSSRASIMLAGAGLLILLGLVLCARDRRSHLVAAAGLIALCVGVLFFFTSPAVFPDAPAGSATGNPLAATETRGSQQSLSSDTGYRLDFWRAAIGEFSERPLVGGGFGSFGELSGTHLRPAAVRSPSAHNELLQAFAEGGLVWGPVVLLSALGLSVGAARRGLAQLRNPTPDRAVAWGAGLAGGVLVAHAAVDFDWSYPALAMAVGVVGGLVLAVPRERRSSPAKGPGAKPAVAALCGCLVLGLGAQVAYAHERTTRAVRLSDGVLARSGPASAAESLRGTRSWFYDPRIDRSVLRLPVLAGVGQPLPVDRELLEAAVDRIGPLAAINDTVNAYRAATLFGLGQQDEALSSVRAMALQRAHSRPATLEAYAVLLNLTGSGMQARQLLAGTITRRALEARTNAYLGPQLYTLYLQLTKIAPRSLEERCAGSALLPLNLPLPATAVPLARTGSTDSCAFLNEKGWA